MLDFRLHTFLTLCETMNYTRAAERLCITQPAVSQHIHFLEAHYGCRLFTYQNKTLRLTPAGETQCGLAHSLAYNSRKIEEALAHPGPAALHIGATKTIGSFVIAPLVSRFLRAHPHCSFSLTVDNTDHLLAGLDRGVLDFALIEGFFDKGRYGSRLMREEAFFGICAPDHPLAGQTVPLHRLFAANLIVREPGSGTRDIFETLVREHNHTLTSFAGVTEISDFSVMKTLVAQGLGITFVYAPVAAAELAAGTLARIDLEGPPILREFNCVYLRDSLFPGLVDEWLTGAPETYRAV